MTFKSTPTLSNFYRRWNRFRVGPDVLGHRIGFIEVSKADGNMTNTFDKELVAEGPGANESERLGLQRPVPAIAARPLGRPRPEQAFAGSGPVPGAHPPFLDKAPVAMALAVNDNQKPPLFRILTPIAEAAPALQRRRRLLTPIPRRCDNHRLLHSAASAIQGERNGVEPYVS